MKSRISINTNESLYLVSKILKRSLKTFTPDQEAQTRNTAIYIFKCKEKENLKYKLTIYK